MIAELIDNMIAKATKAKLKPHTLVLSSSMCTELMNEVGVQFLASDYHATGVIGEYRGIPITPHIEQRGQQCYGTILDDTIIYLTTQPENTDFYRTTACGDWGDWRITETIDSYEDINWDDISQLIT